MAMRKQGTTPTGDGWRNRIVGEGMVAAADEATLAGLVRSIEDAGAVGR